MKTAILDLGTNTFNIYIAEIFSDKTFKELYKSKISVKLGEGGINKNFIGEIPFERGVQALKKFKKRIVDFGVEKVIAYGTSAIRSASNGNEFVKQVHLTSGINIQVIGGEREAELIYYGVRSGIQMLDANSLIIDIGGGSTEFIIANKTEVIWKQSFLLGVARLLEKFKPSNPITPEEIKQIESYLQQELQPLFLAVDRFASHSTPSPDGRGLERGLELIGSSGSFDSLAEMIAHRFYTLDILTGTNEYEFNLEEANKIYSSIVTSTTKERIKMPGLIKMRVDMIVISLIIINFIIVRLGITKMRLSKFSLKEGVLWELMYS